MPTFDALKANGTVSSTGVIRNQSPDWSPVPKVVSSGVVGAVTVILFAALHSLAPNFVINADLQAAVVTVLMFLAGYITPPGGFTAPAVMAGSSNVVGALLLAVFLNGCTPVGIPAPGASVSTPATVTVDPDAQKLTVCRAYDATLRSLAGFAGTGQLTPAEVASVNTARPTLNAMCKSPDPWTQSVVDQAEVILEGMLLTEKAHTP